MIIYYKSAKYSLIGRADKLKSAGTVKLLTESDFFDKFFN